MRALSACIDAEPGKLAALIAQLRADGGARAFQNACRHRGVKVVDANGKRGDELTNCLLYQIGALSAFCRASGGRLSHVKAHGALYNTIVRHQQQADAARRGAADRCQFRILRGFSFVERRDGDRRFGERREARGR